MHLLRTRTAAPIAAALLVTACGGADRLSPDLSGPSPDVQPAACDLLTPVDVATALAPAPAAASTGSSSAASTAASTGGGNGGQPQGSGAQGSAASGNALGGQTPGPAGASSSTQSTAAATGSETTLPAPTAFYSTGLIQVGSRQVKGGQCTWRSAGGGTLVVSVLPATKLSALGGGSALGPAVYLASDTASLIGVPKGSAVVEIALDFGGVTASERGNRLVRLASVVASENLPTLAPQAQAAASSTAATSAQAAAGEKVNGQNAQATVTESDQLKFSPASSSIQAGQVVEWRNGGSVPHNVTFDDYPELTSDTMNGGDTYEVRFTQKGTYAYHCTFHPGMNGTITVG